jgi:uracil-DNA glycosylase
MKFNPHDTSSEPTSRQAFHSPGNSPVSRVAREFDALHNNVVKCTRCPRLRSYCTDISRVKKREFREEKYWGLPVPGFGDPFAKLWIVGLAPAAHGANRTGRMFTGDKSGEWLFRALYRVGYASQAESLHKEDGLKLKDVYISAAVRCAPPDNKPALSEIRNCQDYLFREFDLLENKKGFLALGKIGFDAILRLLELKGVEIPKPRPKFFHGAVHEIGKYRVFASYHPSRQNTQTGRLTDAMWMNIFRNIKKTLF